MVPCDAATAPAAGRDGDVDLAEGPEFVGFDAVADRTSVCRARRGAFQGAIHEFDASDRFCAASVHSGKSGTKVVCSIFLVRGDIPPL